MSSIQFKAVVLLVHPLADPLNRQCSRAAPCNCRRTAGQFTCVFTYNFASKLSREPRERHELCVFRILRGVDRTFALPDCHGTESANIHVGHLDVDASES